MTVYGRFLQWVAFRYDLTQAQLAEIMGTSQSTVSNWQIGEYEASWKANARMADKLGFDIRLRDLLAHVFTYGQGVAAPTEEPEDFPFSLAREVGVNIRTANPRFPGGAISEEHQDVVLEHEDEKRAQRDKKQGANGQTEDGPKGDGDGPRGGAA